MSAVHIGGFNDDEPHKRWPHGIHIDAEAPQRQREAPQRRIYVPRQLLDIIDAEARRQHQADQKRFAELRKMGFITVCSIMPIQDVDIYIRLELSNEIRPYLNDALSAAHKNGRHTVVNKLIAAGAEYERDMLIWAIENYDDALTSFLVDKGELYTNYTLYYTLYYGRPKDPFTEALKYKNVHALVLLLNSGIDVNEEFIRKWFRSAFEVAVDCGDVEVARVFVSRGAVIQNYYFSKSFYNRNLPMIKFLLEQGARPDLRDICRMRDDTITDCVLSGGVKISDFDIEDVVEYNYRYVLDRQLASGMPQPILSKGLVIAVKTLNFEVMDLLLKYGVDPNASENGQNVLHRVLETQHADVTPALERLFAAGATLNASNKYDLFNVIRQRELTDGFKNIARLLIRKGSDPNENLTGNVPHGRFNISRRITKDDEGVYEDPQTILSYAAAAGQREIVMDLLKAGADARAYNNDALLQFCRDGPDDEEIACALIDAGVDVHAQNECALLKAALRCSLKVVSRLLKAGANARANGNYILKRLQNRNDQEGSGRALKLLMEHLDR